MFDQLGAYVVCPSCIRHWLTSVPRDLIGCSRPSTVGFGAIANGAYRSCSASLISTSHSRVPSSNIAISYIVTYITSTLNYYPLNTGSRPGCEDAGKEIG